MPAESPALGHLPWKTEPIIYPGAEGVVLAKNLDHLTPTELARGTNIVPRIGGGFDVRGGLTYLASAGSSIHSEFRLNDPNASAFTRFWGVDTQVGVGATGAITSLEAGFSGNPLSWVAWQSELTGTPWLYIADSLKMRKVQRTGNTAPIGIAKPAQPGVATGALDKVAVAAFNATDGTDAAHWTSWSGAAIPPATGNPAAFLVTNAPAIIGNGVAFTPQAGGVTGGGYYSAATLAKVLDLSTLASGTATTDDDIFHLRMLIDRPDYITEVRLYFIVSPVIASESALPGGPNSIFNTSAYMRAFIPSEYTQAVAGAANATGAAQNIQQLDFVAGFQDPAVTGATTPSTSSRAGSNVWNEYGIIDFPVRRGDFLQLGNAGLTGFTWANVKGLVVAVFVNSANNVNVTLNDSYFTGGGNPDTSEPDAQPYDYRVTNKSKSSGAESNPSDIMATTINALRQKVTVTPVASGNADYFQQAYRRGGTNTDDWYFVGNNAADGAAITDNTSDTTALAAGPVDKDHDQPVTTTDVNGNAVFAQPLPVIFGPIENYMIALGDPNRPGDFYWCKQNEPDHWPAANHETACPPSEQLMNGGKLASGQGFLFSRQRLYSVTISGADGPTSTPTDCAKGMAGRWGMDVGPDGIYFVARSDGVYRTSGSTPVVVSDQIRPLFHGVATNGYNPIDWTQENALRLRVCGDDLWFGFQDTSGARVWWVYSILYHWWRCATFAAQVGNVFFEPHATTGPATVLLGGLASGRAYTNTGLSDDGSAITWNMRTGALYGDAREEKLLGDLTIWGDFGGATVSATIYRNNEKVVDASQVLASSTTYDRYIWDIFGTNPEHAQSVSLDLTGGGPITTLPFVGKLGFAVSPQPEVTMNRVTQWMPLGNGKGEVYLTGCYIDSDTGGTSRTILVEVLLGGKISTASTLTVQSAGGRRQWFSWNAVKADMVRLRPSGVCAPWMLFGQDWLFDQEPPRVQTWDTNFEDLGDAYCTGLDLDVDTFNLPKKLHVSVDGVEIVNSPFTITNNGRRFVHLTFTPIRGHIFRAFCLTSDDTNVGLFYSHRWIHDAEPGEQTNWNQNFTIAGTQADKWLKGFIVEADTFNAVKLVNVEVDGVAVAGGPFSVQTNGRKVAMVSFPQVEGRVFRLLPADAFPSRLYSLSWIFDEEPYQLTRFETQEQPNGIDDWQIPVRGQIALKSNDIVNMQVLTYGQGAQILSNQTYALPSTGGVKAQVSLHPFLTAQKGVFIKFIFTCASGFWLYREESWLQLQPWGGGSLQIQKPFGNDDLGPDRVMRNASLAAAKSGGTPVG